MSPLTLAERIVAIDSALSAVPHAFGGALALAYYAEPRATVDIDLNLFVPADRYGVVFSPLGQLGADVDHPALAELVERDDQVRVMWETTPLDLFFAYDPFHVAAGAGCRTVPFAATTIPILAPEHLMVCKAVFNRPKDWLDIEGMLAVADVGAAEVIRWVARIAGEEDPRFDRVVALLTGR